MRESHSPVLMGSGLLKDAEGNTEPFVVKVWNQYVAEKQDYLRELQNELGHVM